MLYCDILVSEFDLQSRYCVYLVTNTLGERHELTHPPSYGLNNTTSVLLLRWLWY